MASKAGKMGVRSIKAKSYAHFDLRTPYSKVARLIENPEWVSRHGFLPLISKTITRNPFDRETGHKAGPKIREVAYAGHIDGFIYQRYAFLLNEAYNVFAEKHGINRAAIAYRTNLGMSNIDFALMAFGKAMDMGRCWVFTADIKDFFPSIDHALLKTQLKRLFPNGTIPNDYYNVFKSAIHWSQWDIESLLSLNGLNPKYPSSIRALNAQKRVLAPEQFRENCKQCISRPWLKERRGIPQGLAISGVLANIFMMDFDCEMQRSISQAGGLYMRYSDDVVFIVPSKRAFQSCTSLFHDLCDAHRLVDAPEKTASYCISESLVMSCDRYGTQTSTTPTSIQYLGFDFDGSRIKIRQKTIGKYYRKMRRKVAGICYKKGTPSKKWIRQLYTQYSDKGVNTNRGNFLTYSHRAQAKCQRKGLPNRIEADTKNHYLKIKRTLQQSIRL